MNDLFRGKTILIVDDELGIREILTDEFEFCGATVFSAESGQAAYEVILSQPCDAVISDMRMRNGDGTSLIEKINLGEGAKPKLFLCSGFNPLSPEEAGRLRLTEVFDKPFNPGHLVRSVALALGLPTDSKPGLSGPV